MAKVLPSRLLFLRRSRFAFFFFSFLVFSEASGSCSDYWGPELLEGLAGGVTDNPEVIALNCVFSGCSRDSLNVSFRGRLPLGTSLVQVLVVIDAGLGFSPVCGCD